MNTFMVPIYVSLIKKGKKTLEEVPMDLREAVKEALGEGYQDPEV